MIFSLTKRVLKIKIKTLIIIFLVLVTNAYQSGRVLSSTLDSKDEVANSIKQIIENRNKALLNGDLEFIESIYDKSTQYGTWAYEHEEKKMKYIHNWGEKQGVKFIDIIPQVVIKSIRGNTDKYTVNLICSTEYKYVYEDSPYSINTSRIGTDHLVQIAKKDGVWIITKEWYKDPFADSLNLDNLKVDSMKQYMATQTWRDFTNINKRRLRAVEYAEQHCGTASEEKYGFRYNPKYRDYNSEGGDCANFASQVLFEGGKFRKSSAWNYDEKDATRAWLNADGFKEYMINSGRASVIAAGSYEKVYKASYRLLPGDFVAYEKKGDITHISVVTGADSKGYSLVSCHNTDRNRVPWDLGWSDKNIKFWLVRVHY